MIKKFTSYWYVYIWTTLNNIQKTWNHIKLSASLYCLTFEDFNPPFKLYMHSIYEQHPNNLKSNRNLCKFILPNFQTFRYNIPWLSLEHDLNLPEVTLLFCWLSWALFLSLEVGVERLLRELLRLELLWDPLSLQEGFVIVGHLLPLLNGDGNLQKRFRL